MVKIVLNLCKVACVSGLFVLPNFGRHLARGWFNIDLT